MKLQELIASIEAQCSSCEHCKFAVHGIGKDKWKEPTCEIYQRVWAMLYHPDIVLKDIDIDKGLCLKYARE